MPSKTSEAVLPTGAECTRARADSSSEEESVLSSPVAQRKAPFAFDSERSDLPNNEIPLTPFTFGAPASTHQSGQRRPRHDPSGTLPNPPPSPLTRGKRQKTAPARQDPCCPCSVTASCCERNCLCAKAKRACTNCDPGCKRCRNSQAVYDRIAKQRSERQNNPACRLF